MQLMLGNTQNVLSDVPNIYLQNVTAIGLESLKIYFDEKQDTTLIDIIDKIQLPKSSKVYFSQFITLLKILRLIDIFNEFYIGSDEHFYLFGRFCQNDLGFKT